MLPFLLPLLASAGGAALNAAGGAIGGAAAGDDRARQRALIEAILKDYDNIDVPELQTVNAETLGPSAMEGVSTDPRLRGEQMAVLERLGRLSETGDDAVTKAAMNKILGDLARQESAGRNAITNNMRARGVSGSGAELAAQLSAHQGNADRAQTAGLEHGAQAQRRILDALSGRGQLAGSLRQQDFGENSAKAQARDAINRYNAGSREKATYYNAQLPAQQFALKMQKLAGKSTAARGAADQAGRDGDRTANMWAGIGNAGNTAMTGLAGHLSRRDEDEEDGY
jgi:hypothetical protein